MAMTGVQLLIACTALQRVWVDAAPNDFLGKNQTDAATAKLPQAAVSGDILGKNGTTPALPQTMLEWSQNDPRHASAETANATLLSANEVSFRQCNTLLKRTWFAFHLIIQCPLLTRRTIASCAALANSSALVSCLSEIQALPVACAEAVKKGCGELEPKCCRCETKDKTGCLFEGYQGDSCDGYCKNTVEDSDGRYPVDYKFRDATCEVAREKSTLFHGHRDCVPATPLKCCRCQTNDEKGCLVEGIQGFACDDVCKKLENSPGRYPWSWWGAYKFHGSCETAKKEAPFSSHQACI